MHVMQRKRRQSLRRRVMEGEVELEALGIRHLTVPQQVLDKMPIVAYTPGPDAPQQRPLEPPDVSIDKLSEAEAKEAQVSIIPHRVSEPKIKSTQPPLSPTSPQFHFYSQPTCPICLDDFEAGETQVRELPCHHIFHPECVDTFLLNNSSLCPMCKKSALPKGHCPEKITNAMVRREMLLRRIRRERGDDDSTAQTNLGASAGSRLSGFQNIGTAIGGHRRMSSAPADTAIEMRTGPGQPPVDSPPVALISPQSRDPNTAAASSPTSPTRTDSQVVPPSASRTSHTRREWARQRALAMLSTRVSSVDVEEEQVRREVAARPTWRKIVGKLFPGLA